MAPDRDYCVRQLSAAANPPASLRESLLHGDDDDGSDDDNDDLGGDNDEADIREDTADDGGKQSSAAGEPGPSRRLRRGERADSVSPEELRQRERHAQRIEEYARAEPGACDCSIEARGECGRAGLAYGRARVFDRRCRPHW